MDFMGTMEGSLFVFGNLLLDMVVPVDEDYLKSYGLIPDSIQMASDHQLKIYQDICQLSDVKLSPGGSAMNTARMTQKILSSPKDVIVMIGAVGSDDIGRRLVQTVENEGIKMLVQEIKGSSSGKCASLLTSGGSARTMVTDLGASIRFSHDLFMKAGDLKWAERAKCIYISGYFLKVSPETVFEVVKHAKGKNKSILLNLNAVWVTTCCKHDLIQLLPYVDVLFGNESEVASFHEQLLQAKPEELTESLVPSQTLRDMTTELSRHTKVTKASDPRLVVVTRGDKPVLCVEGDNVKEYQVANVAKEDLIDTTGAGDAFVGGFLSCYIREMSIDECINCGIWAATQELKGYGFILPSEIPQEFSLTQTY